MKKIIAQETLLKVALALTVVHGVASTVYAQNGNSEVDIATIRREIQEARAHIAKTEDSSLEDTRSNLLAKEEQILAELKKEEGAITTEQATVAGRAAAVQDLQKLSGLEETVAAPSRIQAVRGIGVENFSNAARELEASLARLKNSNTQLEQESRELRTRNQTLSKELQETRDRLMIIEAENERLAQLLHTQNASTLAKFNITSNKPVTTALQNANTPTTTQASTPRVTTVVQKRVEKTEEDMPVATVIADKANLRTGPSKDNSPLMSVAKGSRLAVEARQGAWYRVITPTGARAWVSSDIVAFGEGTQPNSTSTIRVRGFDPSLENEGTKAIVTRSN